MTARGARILLVAGSALVALALAEGALRLAGLPREHRPHARDPQFVSVKGADFGYTNVPNAAIRFSYDSDPRGYFGPSNEIVQHTNSQGFRGAPFSIQKPAGTLRLIFLGDSFTFGEGVKDQDTYVARLEQELAARSLFPGKKVEALNLGVGGFNTAQEAALLRQFGIVLAPDRVFVAYCLNDAEDLLYSQAADGTWSRRRRGGEVPEDVGTPEPPPAIRPLNLTRLAWLAWQGPALTRQTVEHYRALYREGSPGWERARVALQEISRLCRERRVPVTVLVFPVFFRLGEDYPFAEIHRQVCAAAEQLGMGCLDLLPAFAGFSGPELWVHPSDQHPNEIAHALVARRLAEALAQEPAPPSGTQIPTSRLEDYLVSRRATH